MVFVGGPRQVGKTTLGLAFLRPSSEKNPAYLSWDILQHRKNILKNQIPLQYTTLVFGEIHKFKHWRGLMKGLYDENRSDHSFLVTGSARLDHFSKGGDSLMGRYFYYCLHPFSLMEMNPNPNKGDLETLMKFGGFPEPLFRQSEDDWRRWQNSRRHQVVYDDLRDLERVKEISLIELLLESLPERVGSPLSVNSLRQDLSVSHQSVESWIKLLEVLYMLFRIPPYGGPRIRAVKKERKLYFWDWSCIESEGFRFENLVACHLLKYCHYQRDVKGLKMELRYLRDIDKREVDFIVLKNKKPMFAVECKLKETNLSPSLGHFQKKLSIPRCYQVHLASKDFGNDKQNGRCLPFVTFCREVLKI
ncbi:MAG: AAA family ATPase [Halobacteriovoraceae bacterium]|nr:AAA family ATPase [Halobacteriovoraceae bacterium]